MEDFRKNYNYKQRMEFQETILDMREYLLAVLLKVQGGVCKMCGKTSDKWDIHHTIYNPMMTIKELDLLCIPCHKSITNFTRLDHGVCVV